MNMSDSHRFLAGLTWLTPDSQHGQSPDPGESGSPSAIKHPVPDSYQPAQTDMVKSRDSPYYSPPPTFMPPESPNMIRHAPHGLPSPPDEWPTVPTRTPQFQYNGVMLAPGQLAHLTALGKIRPSMTDSKVPLKGVPGVSGAPHAQHKSPSDKWPYFGPLRNGTSALKGPDMDSDPHPRKSTHDCPQPSNNLIGFTGLAAKNGAREWDPNVFDDRWLLRPETMWRIDPRRRSSVAISPTAMSTPDEMWNIEPHHRSVTTISPNATPRIKALSASSTSANTIQLRRRSAQGMGHENGHDYIKDPLGAYAALLGIVPSNEGQPKKSLEESTSAFILDADLLPEIRRLEGVFREHAGASSFLPQGLPYERDSVREYFQTSVFGTKDARTLSTDDAALKVLYGSNIITRGELHEYLFRVLDCMAEDMTTPRARIKNRGVNALRVRENDSSNTKTALGTALANSPPPNDHDSIQTHSSHRSGQLAIDLPSERQVDNQAARSAASSGPPSRYGLQPHNPNMQPIYDHLSANEYHPYHQQQMEYPPRFPTSYHQNLQTLQQSFAPPYPSQGPSVNPGYGRQPAFHAPNATMPAHFQATRPAAPQRLAPSILRTGALGFSRNCMTSPDFTPTQSNVDLAQSVPQCNLFASSDSTEVLQPTTFPSSYDPTQVIQPSAYSVPSSSAANWQPTMEFASPDPLQNSQSFQNSAIREAAQFVRLSRSSTPAGRLASLPITQNAEWEHRFGILPTKPSVLPLPYHVGLDHTASHAAGGSSIALQELTRNGKPTYAVAMAVAPFEETAKDNKSQQWGVLRIGNIPYSLTRAEVITFLGRNAKLVSPEFGSPIHIIMDRSTGKTNDCYVEFFSIGDAQAVVNRLRQRSGQIKIGTPPNDRVVTVEISSQDVLLKELFPRAKNVVWKDGNPTVEKSTEPYNSGFKAFVTGEEMIMLVRHAEQPHRSSYTQKCPQRTFETMISTLTKFPWCAVNYYTINTRNQVFSATRDQIKILVNNLKRGGGLNINQALLTELMIAGLNAPGFSEKQRWELVQGAEYVGGQVNLSPLMKWWPWEALGRKTGSEEDVFEYYASLFKSHPTTNQDVSDNPFGELLLATSADMNTTTMEEMGRLEWTQVQGLLRDVLG